MPLFTGFPRSGPLMLGEGGVRAFTAGRMTCSLEGVFYMEAGPSRPAALTVYSSPAHTQQLHSASPCRAPRAFFRALRAFASMTTDLAGDSDCPICYLRYNRAGRAPRLLPCGHALCTCCLGEMLATCCHHADSPLTCPFCRAPTSLDCTRQQLTSLPLDLGLWERLGPDTGEDEEETVCATLAPEEEPTLPSVGKWKPWRAFKKLMTRKAGHRTRRQGFEHDDLRDIAMMTCYFL